MFSKKSLTIILISLAIFQTAKSEDDWTQCGDTCMQCVARYGRNYCNLCHGTRNEWGRCGSKVHDSDCVTRDPNGVCARCKDGMTLRTSGAIRDCVKEAKSHKNCVAETVFPDGWTKCQVCKGGNPERFHGKCEEWDKEDRKFHHCQEAAWGVNGFPQCFKCAEGYVVHYNSLRPFDGTWCVKEDDSSLDEDHIKTHKGCLTYNVGYRFCDICNVEAGFYKKNVYHRHCTAKKAETA